MLRESSSARRNNHTQVSDPLSANAPSRMLQLVERGINESMNIYIFSGQSAEAVNDAERKSFT